MNGRATPHDRWQYQPALDGLRAFAVVAVMLYHGGVPWLRGGYLGVDVFFVLSGFLITTLLLREHAATGRVDIVAFWKRRVRRLMPALVFLLTVVAGFSAFALSTSEAVRARNDGLATLSYVSNWWFVVSGRSYFEGFGAASPLRHTWSLSIEEQFYVVWPVVLLGIIVLFRRIPRASVIVPVAGAVISAGLMALWYVPGRDPSRVYYGTDTRLQGVLIGAALAMLFRNGTHIGNRIVRGGVHCVGLVAAVVLAWAAVTMSDTNDRMYRFGFLAASIAAAVLILAAVQAGGPLRRVLAWRPFVAIGLISYGLYLWHWPIYTVLTPARVHVTGWALLGLRVAVTLAAAIVSYRLVERPLRSGGFQWRLRIAVPGALAVVAIVLCVAAVVPGATRAAASAPLLPNVSAKQQAEHNRVQAEIAAQPGAVKALLVGDSVALTLGMAYDARSAGEPNLAVSTTAKVGCGIALGRIFSDGEDRPTEPGCEELPGMIIDAYEKERPDVSVILLGAWEFFSREVGSTRVEFGTPEFETLLGRPMRAILERLTADGRPVLLLTPPCFENSETAPLPWGSERADPARAQWFTGFLTRLAAERPDVVRVMDVRTHLCPLDRWNAVLGGAPMLADGVHFSYPGGAALWRWFAPRVDAVARYPSRVVAPR